MSFDLEAAQNAAQRRMERNLDVSVRAAQRRIRRYTEAERMEVARGVRESERRRNTREQREAIEAIGKAFDVIFQSIGDAAEKLGRAFGTTIDAIKAARNDQ